jgi:hypothetical protein
MGGHWEATGRPLGDRRRRGTGFIMGKVTLTGATILPVCPTCMSFGTYPASTAALDAPTGNTIHNITIHTYIHTLQYTIQYILLPHNITVYPNTQFELQPHNTSPNHTVQEHTHHVYLTCSVHGLSEVVEQLEVLPTL